MRILYITTWCPFPPDNGSKLRGAYLLRALARRHEVTLLTFAPEGQTAATISDMAPPLAGFHPVHEDAFRYTQLPALVKYGSPMPLAFWRHPAMVQQTAALSERYSFDVVVAMSVPVVRYALQVKNAPCVLDVESSQTLVLEERYRSGQSFAARQRYRIGWKKSAFYESRLMRSCDACTIVSEKELDYYAPMLRGASSRLAVVPNGVDLAHMQRGMVPKQDAALIFNGALTYSANYDAMQYFLSDIYPRIRQRIPGVSLTITGSTQGVDMKSLELDDSVHFSGYVPDIRPLVAGATVCVAPLRQGGGTRLKILEAMALGTPVVATSKGMEGLDVIPEQHILLGDDPQAFADQTARLLEDPTRRQSLAATARELVESAYDWTEIGNNFRRLVEEVGSAQKRPVN